MTGFSPLSINNPSKDLLSQILKFEAILPAHDKRKYGTMLYNITLSHTSFCHGRAVLPQEQFILE